ncbi:echinoderm microtubule-associated protein-like 1 [Xyrauchen texanus]|uniref:echinoderm microtubule-associated protein-like 1 n=1 Tax=Xyrauchen texanus TaxID=154827 RepID=UPI00224199DA|nr:echinoderm microtubule-associated protein-like 1 [Xyrauchen texanus]XP_051951644.1 echinoderm microtubule-associated protein-like 1 [Xyrauchen texanus]
MEDLMERCEDEGAGRTDSYDFIIDDQSCHTSSLEVCDRLTFLEQRVQMQDEEVQLLKMTMADVLKRLNISEEQTAALTKKTTNKAARPVSLTLPAKSASSLRKSSSSTLPSSSSTRNYSPSQASRRTGSAKDSPSGSTSGKTTYKKLETNPKEATSSIVGSRRVSHCKDLSEPPVKKDWIY